MFSLGLNLSHDCPLCIGGWQPDGIHPVLGPVMVACAADVTCWACGGNACFPTDSNYMTHFANLMAARGYRIDFCMVCLGVTEVIPMTGDTR